MINTDDDATAALQSAVAKKMTGPSTNPKGWTMGKKKGWNGGLLPPGLAKRRSVTTPSTTPGGVNTGVNSNAISNAAGQAAGALAAAGARAVRTLA